ncbi:hypothetical protein [Amycolatopsis sp. GA6-003]|uniref:hypothetical protein n=1 Tax=Amycolatopsis sp. GA6-003 TaxID=2652444 RepID=UPI0039172B3C
MAKRAANQELPRTPNRNNRRERHSQQQEIRCQARKMRTRNWGIHRERQNRQRVIRDGNEAHTEQPHRQEFRSETSSRKHKQGPAGEQRSQQQDVRSQTAGTAA